MARIGVVTSIAVLVIALSSCGVTTYEADVTVPAAETTSTTLPSGTADELLPRLAAAMNSLSSYIGPDAGQNTPAGKHEILESIDDLWDAARDEVTAANPDAADTITRMVDLAHTAVERNRPADADKAAKFATQVIDGLLAQ